MVFKSNEGGGNEQRIVGFLQFYFILRLKKSLNRRKHSQELDKNTSCILELLNRAGFCDRVLKAQRFVSCPAGAGGSKGVRHGGSGKLKGFQRAAQTSSRPRQTVSCLSEPSGAVTGAGQCKRLCRACDLARNWVED